MAGLVLAETEDRSVTLDGERAEAIRTALGLSQQAVAEALGMSQGGVSYLETRQSNPRAKTLREMARLYGVSAEDLGPGGREIELVLGEVRRKQRPRQTTTPMGEALPLAPYWGEIGSLSSEFGFRGRFEHVLAHAIVGVGSPAVAEVTEDDPRYGLKAGELVIFNPDQPWQDGRLHLFEYNGFVVLERVRVSENVLRWVEPDSEERVGIAGRVRLYGVAVYVQPRGRPV